MVQPCFHSFSLTGAQSMIFLLQVFFCNYLAPPSVCLHDLTLNYHTTETCIHSYLLILIQLKGAPHLDGNFAHAEDVVFLFNKPLLQLSADNQPRGFWLALVWITAVLWAEKLKVRTVQKDQTKKCVCMALWMFLTEYEEKLLKVSVQLKTSVPSWSHFSQHHYLQMLRMF